MVTADPALGFSREIELHRLPESGTRTWTDEYTMLRIHRGIVTLRAPGRMMRSDALALDEATIAGIHRSTAFDSR